ncbi:hypothetical protein CW304_05805 [Bacillus sp. UFRGS-B20]|nr:hypothetical protein CW304_05805 [Bacillus sp. UFRGS-B20]
MLLKNVSNVLGVSEPTIQIEGADEFVVQLAWCTRSAKSSEMFQLTSEINIRDVDDNLLMDGTEFKRRRSEANI